MDGETKAYLDDMKADLKGEISTLRADMDQRSEQVIDLIQAMATGTAQRFDSVETRLDAIERRFDGQPPLKLVP